MLSQGSSCFSLLLLLVSTQPRPSELSSGPTSYRDPLCSAPAHSLPKHGCSRYPAWTETHSAMTQLFTGLCEQWAPSRRGNDETTGVGIKQGLSVQGSTVQQWSHPFSSQMGSTMTQHARKPCSRTKANLGTITATPNSGFSVVSYTKSLILATAYVMPTCAQVTPWCLIRTTKPYCEA